MEKAEFESAVKAAGGKIGFGSKQAYFFLRGMVQDGEKIVTAGEFFGKRSGAVIITQNNFYGVTMLELLKPDSTTIPLKNISSFSFAGGFINISEGSLVHSYPQITNQENIMAAIKAGQSAPAVGVPPIDTAAELRKFKALLDDGIITQADFDKKKAALLEL